MNKEEALSICRIYTRNDDPDEVDDLIYEESLQYLISRSDDPQYPLVSLGLHYGRQGRYDLAQKCYERAIESDNLYAWLNLGDIWYYGKNGTVDYEKAFHCYHESMIRGDFCAAQQYADMYRDGLYVEKDYEHYKELINKLFFEIRNLTKLDEPVPEVYLRMARIHVEEGDLDDALPLYTHARSFLEQRISYSRNENNFLLMKEIIEDVYSIIPFDYTAFHFYDLYYFMNRSASIRFKCSDPEAEIQVNAIEENGNIYIKSEDKWYRSIHEYLQKSSLPGISRLARIYDRLYDFEVIE